jgi:hypothetical protein
MLLLLATLLLPPVFSSLLDGEREICHGDVYFRGIWRGLEVEDELELFLRSILACFCLGE